MTMSPELKDWLLQREKFLQLKRKISADGGHIMLRAETYDPNELEEPLRTEALDYLNALREMDAKSNTAQESTQLN